MNTLYTLLFAGLVFAGIVLLLLSLVYIWRECLEVREPPTSHLTPQPDEERELIAANNAYNYNNGAGSVVYIPQLSENQVILPQIAPAASAPVLTDLNWNDTPMGRIRRNTSTHSFDIQISLVELRAIQAGILRRRISGELMEDTDNCNLIIGVFANPMHFCGYCVNVKENWVEFYKIQTNDLPWQLLDQSDNSEFEMRNFFFAIMLWNDSIKKAGKFNIYTGSRAINYDNNRLWRRATKLLEHMQGCHRIVVGNDPEFYVNPRKNAAAFAVKIVPAEDLSDNIDHFITFISQYYSIPINNFKGSHHIPKLAEGSNDVTDKYQLYIDEVRGARMKCAEACSSCGYIDDEAAMTAQVTD